MAKRGRAASSLPRSLRILLEAALLAVAQGRLPLEAATAIADWAPGDSATVELCFGVGRVLMQDASGIPLLADLAALRDVLAEEGKDPAIVDLAIPAALVVDHAVETAAWGHPDALSQNLDNELAANEERYSFLRWAESAFANLAVVPPGNGIVHQIHLECLAEVVSTRDGWCVCDTVIGTDSHTTMVNALGVVGWGVGGIEAEAALLGRPTSISVPEIVAVELVGRPPAGIFAADVALALTARLRAERVVGAFLEFQGPGVAALGVADRATIANMSPEFGASLALFPVDDAVIDYLRGHGRSEQHIELVREHLTRQGLFGQDAGRPGYDRVITFDLSDVATAAAGPTRPDQLLRLSEIPESFHLAARDKALDPRVALAAITSCTNTANLKSMLAAGLLAKKAVDRGLAPPPWVKTVLAPGSRATLTALERAGLAEPLAQLGFHVAAFGCGPCVGNVGGLTPQMEADLGTAIAAAAVLSSNRNFDGRIHPKVGAAYLMSPALVVAFALAGRIDLDLTRDPIADGVGLEQIWPTDESIEQAQFGLDHREFGHRADPTRWDELKSPLGQTYPWSATSTHFVRPPFFGRAGPDRLRSIRCAKPLLVLGDKVSTDDISPVGRIPHHGAAAEHLVRSGVPPDAFGTYSARRVNHEVMLRGTFANPRLRDRLADRTGGVARHIPSGDIAPVHAVAERYQREGQSLVILAGENYGAGSARDWAAKGTALLGVRAVLARSFERIHRSNLVNLGVLPVEVPSAGDPWEMIGAGSEVSVSMRLPAGVSPRVQVEIELKVDGAVRHLQGILQVTTESELSLLGKGDIFQACLSDMRGGG